MKTYLDCLPCLTRQTLEAIRMVSDDETFQEKIFRQVLQDMSRMDLLQPPPAMAQQIHRLLRQLTGNDPYKDAKAQANQLALSLLPQLKETVRDSSAPLETAVRLAIAGNIIDMGIGFNPRFEDQHLFEAIDHALHSPFQGDISAFSQAISQAKQILYLIDNAGEIVFDKLLIELLPKEKITAVVKGTPIINDATLEDAETVGLPNLVPVIDNGSDAPGTILEDCGKNFIERYLQADLIIAKGQAHYETLNAADKDIFFILKAKCPVIARDLNCKVGDMILQRSAAERSRHVK